DASAGWTRSGAGAAGSACLGERVRDRRARPARAQDHPLQCRPEDSPPGRPGRARPGHERRAPPPRPCLARTGAPAPPSPLGARAWPGGGPAVDEGTCFGYADIGFQRGRKEHVDLSPMCKGLVTPTAVVAHELGHVLGLNHARRGCATMTPIVWTGCKPAP